MSEDSVHALRNYHRKYFQMVFLYRLVIGLLRDENKNMVSEAKAYFGALLYPDNEEGEAFEEKALENVFALQKLWGEQKYKNRL